MVAGFCLTGRAADDHSLAARNLEWAGVVVNKIEKDLGELSQKAGLTDTNLVAEAVRKLRAKADEMKSGLKFSSVDDNPEGAALDFSRTMNWLEQSLIDHMADIDGRERDFNSFTAENSDFADGEFAKKFHAAQASAASNLIAMLAYEIGEQSTVRIKAECAYKTDMLVSGQTMDAMRDEADFLANKAEMVDRNKARSKPVDLSRLDNERKRVRDALKDRQQIELEDLELETKANLLQEQRDRLNDKRGELDGQVNEARDAFNEVHGELDEAIDSDQ